MLEKKNYIKNSLVDLDKRVRILREQLDERIKQKKKKELEKEVYKNIKKLL